MTIYQLYKSFEHKRKGFFVGKEHLKKNPVSLFLKFHMFTSLFHFQQNPNRFVISRGHLTGNTSHDQNKKKLSVIASWGNR